MVAATMSRIRGVLERLGLARRPFTADDLHDLWVARGGRITPALREACAAYKRNETERERLAGERRTAPGRDASNENAMTDTTQTFPDAPAVEEILRRHIYPGLIVLGIPPAAAEVVERFGTRPGIDPSGPGIPAPASLAADLRSLADRVEAGDATGAAGPIREAAAEIERLRGLLRAVCGMAEAGRKAPVPD